MKRILAFIAVFWWLSSAAHGSWVQSHFSASYQGEGKEKHPKAAAWTMTLPSGSLEEWYACASYSNHTRKVDSRKIALGIEVRRGTTSIEQAAISGRIQGDLFLHCFALETPLDARDTVHFTLRFRKFPRLRSGQFTVASSLLDRDFVERQLAVGGVQGNTHQHSSRSGTAGESVALSEPRVSNLRAAHGGWMSVGVITTYEGERKEKHPKKAAWAMTLPVDLIGRPSVCASYINKAGNVDRRKIKLKIDVRRGTGTVEKGARAGRIQGDIFLDCIPLSAPLSSRDTVHFTLVLRRLPRLRSGPLGFIGFSVGGFIVDLGSSQGHLVPDPAQSTSQLHILKATRKDGVLSRL